MLLGDLQRPARLRILIARRQLHKHRGRPRMRLFQIHLGVSGEITVHLIKRAVFVESFQQVIPFAGVVAAREVPQSSAALPKNVPSAFVFAQATQSSEDRQTEV
jgi:hypothetical protein